jgi:hypothetical protein
MLHNITSSLSVFYGATRRMTAHFSPAGGWTARDSCYSLWHDGFGLRRVSPEFDPMTDTYDALLRPAVESYASINLVDLDYVSKRHG